MDNVLLREGDEGWVLPLIQVTRAGFVQHKARGAMMWRLDLWQGDTMRRLSYTGAVTTWQEDPPRWRPLVIDGAGKIFAKILLPMALASLAKPDFLRKSAGRAE